MNPPWEWRKAYGGFTAKSDRWVLDPSMPSGGRMIRKFHACDVNANLACEPSCGLAGSVEDPNEGSDFCPDCIEVVKQLPAGRPERTYAEF